MKLAYLKWHVNTIGLIDKVEEAATPEVGRRLAYFL
jgi:hypothetical protein